MSAGACRGPAERRHRPAGWPAAAVAGLLVAACSVVACSVAGPPPPVSFAVVAGYVDAGSTSGLAGLIDAARRGAINEVSPVMYELRADGGLRLLDAAQAVRAQARARGIRFVPAVRNLVGDRWDGALVHTVLADPRRRAAHVQNLLRVATSGGWDGIDVDYENLLRTDRAVLTTFLTELGATLHRHGKILTVDVPAAASPGDDAGDEDAGAFDLVAIGRVVDQVRLMAYDHAWESSPAGPIAPLPWVADVLRDATARVPAARMVLGIGGYGYDWSRGRGTALSAVEVFALSRDHSVAIHRDPTSGSPWFIYYVGAVVHTVWFEDAASARAKIELAARFHVAGVSLWQLGGEDPQLWDALAAPLR